MRGGKYRDCGSTLGVAGLKLSGMVYSGAIHMLTALGPDPVTRGLAIGQYRLKPQYLLSYRTDRRQIQAAGV